ncbi:hypothetical protein EYR38_003109 [Pleurotus pulmonarius]|nr:hypothetical protein EYR38_003109 [Pleurotus pulmonarius]
MQQPLSPPHFLSLSSASLFSSTLVHNPSPHPQPSPQPTPSPYTQNAAAHPPDPPAPYPLSTASAAPIAALTLSVVDADMMNDDPPEVALPARRDVVIVVKMEWTLLKASKCVKIHPSSHLHQATHRCTNTGDSDDIRHPTTFNAQHNCSGLVMK